jgi:hypothetical protein
MGGFLAELLTSASDTNGRVILALDQSSLGDGRECLMLSVRMGNRALPLLWEVVYSKGAIGWDTGAAAETLHFHYADRTEDTTQCG